MYTTTKTASGYTLLELLVSIAIIAITLGLVLVAIQKARLSAFHAQSKNHLRQIILAVHQHAGESDGKITELHTDNQTGKDSHGNLTGLSVTRSLYRRLLPYVHTPLPIPYPGISSAEISELTEPNVKIYINPADPSLNYVHSLTLNRAKISYAFNQIVFNGIFDLTSTATDGASQTIAFADKYYARAGNEYTMKLPQAYHSHYHMFDAKPAEVYGERRPTFADRGWHDVMPITDPTMKITRPSVPGKLFQVQPRVEEVDYHILSSPFSSGLTAALADGSVRVIRHGIHEFAYWALITPSAGDIATLD
jgi:prepilin-type N-terminal cleavage/methylation domain-containing protein